MFKELGQIASLMKQAQGMKGKFNESQERMANLKCVGEAGGGMVSVTIGGLLKVLSCRIDPTLIQSGDKEMIEDLIVAATNQALEKLTEEQKKEMSAITGGMDLSSLGNVLGGLGIGK